MEEGKAERLVLQLELAQAETTRKSRELWLLRERLEAQWREHQEQIAVIKASRSRTGSTVHDSEVGKLTGTDVQTQHARQEAHVAVVLRHLQGVCDGLAAALPAFDVQPSTDTSVPQFQVLHQQLTALRDELRSLVSDKCTLSAAAGPCGSARGISTLAPFACTCVASAAARLFSGAALAPTLAVHGARELGWYYRDDASVLRGPHSPSTILRWWCQGFLEDGLLLAAVTEQPDGSVPVPSGSFRPLSELLHEVASGGCIEPEGPAWLPAACKAADGGDGISGSGPGGVAAVADVSPIVADCRDADDLMGGDASIGMDGEGRRGLLGGFASPSGGSCCGNSRDSPSPEKRLKGQATRRLDQLSPRKRRGGLSPCPQQQAHQQHPSPRAQHVQQQHQYQPHLHSQPLLPLKEQRLKEQGMQGQLPPLLLQPQEDRGGDRLPQDITQLDTAMSHDLLHAPSPQGPHGSSSGGFWLNTPGASASPTTECDPACTAVTSAAALPVVSGEGAARLRPRPPHVRSMTPPARVSVACSITSTPGDGRSTPASPLVQPTIQTAAAVATSVSPLPAATIPLATALNSSMASSVASRGPRETSMLDGGGGGNADARGPMRAWVQDTAVAQQHGHTAAGQLPSDAACRSDPLLPGSPAPLLTRLREAPRLESSPMRNWQQQHKQLPPPPLIGAGTAIPRTSSGGRSVLAAAALISAELSGSLHEALRSLSPTS